MLLRSWFRTGERARIGSFEEAVVAVIIHERMVPADHEAELEWPPILIAHWREGRFRYYY